MDVEALLRQYEADGEEASYERARRAYEDALTVTPDSAELHHQYGYLRECHARYELRQAAASYDRAIARDPEWAKPRFQLLLVRAALHEIEDEIRVYRARLQAHPEDLRAYRLLASAYLLAHRPDDADQTAVAGLRLAPNDAPLIRARAEAAAARDQVDDALALWRRAGELDPEDISGEYAAAFLLERTGRIADAADRWRGIIRWCTARGLELERQWPARELARLEEISQRRA